jgi:hypothetical protein
MHDATRGRRTRRVKGTEMARDDTERERYSEGRFDEAEQARLQVVHLLRSILQEAKIQAHGVVPVITPDMQSVIDLYAQIESQIELTCSPSVIP